MREEYFDTFMELNSPEDSESVKEALKNAVMRIGRIIPDAEDILSYVGYQYERQGFLNELTYALSLKGGAG